MNRNVSMISLRAFNEISDTNEGDSRKESKNQLGDLVSRLPGISQNKGCSFTKLNKAVVQALKELTDLIEDMKSNLIPRHEMLLILHKVVGILSVFVDINNVNLEEDYDEIDDEEEAQVPKEVQNWLQLTFMMQEDHGAPRNFSSKGVDLFKSIVGHYKKVPDNKFDTRDIDEIPTKVYEFLQKDKMWQFDIFRFQSMTNDHALKHLLNFFFQKYNFYKLFRIEGRVFNALLNHIEFGYERYKNPYHNTLHATDVLQTLHCLLTMNNTITHLSPLELFTVLFAAAIHDYDHQGVTNNFIIDNRYQLSLTYNDISVQENHHVSATFKLLRKPFLNITSNFSQEQFNEFRSLCIKFVLATDMSSHFIQIKKYNTLIQTKEQIKKSEYLSNLVHTADLSNPSKEWKIHLIWVVRIFNEFFVQGDREKSLGMAISPLCDRTSTLISQSQIGFLDFIIQPTYDLYSNLTEAFLMQLNKEQNVKLMKSVKTLGNLSVQYKYCLNRPWEACIMQNRSNWRRKGDKDYNLLKESLLNADKTKDDKVKEHSI